jgi:hypothetical protein
MLSEGVENAASARVRDDSQGFDRDGLIPV